MGIDRVTSRLVIALGIGIFLGSLICMALPIYLSIVGFLFGVVLSVVILAWKEIVFIAPSAYRETIAHVRYVYLAYRSHDEQRRWKWYSWTAIVSELICMVPMVALTALREGEVPFQMPLWVLCYLSAIPISAVFCYLIGGVERKESAEEKEKRRINLYKTMVVFATPLGPILAVVSVGALIIFATIATTICGVIIIGGEVTRGTYRVVRHIYSRETVLCAFYTFLGITFTYGFLHLYQGYSMLFSLGVGSASGTIFGVMNYEILSKRILKLVPIRPS